MKAVVTVRGGPVIFTGQGRSGVFSRVTMLACVLRHAEGEDSDKIVTQPPEEPLVSQQVSGSRQ